MSDLMRVSITLEDTLYEEMERLMKSAGYNNRSEFIRDLLRERLVKDAWKRNEEALGTITMLYDHERRELSGKIVHLQHHYHDAILATTHVHLSHDLCAEMIMVRGSAERIETLAEGFRREKGVLHVAVAMSSTGVWLQ